MVDTEIVGTPARRMSRRTLVLYAVFCVAAVAYGVVAHQWFFAAYGSMMSVVNVSMSTRPPTRVDAAGVRRPWRRPASISWPEVDCMLAPQPGMTAMRLQLASGKIVPLDDIAAEWCAAVAALGRKDVVRPTLPTVRSGPPPPPRRRTDDDLLADVFRQAAALARQREELAALSRRLRP